jgi:hypothetical protein
MKRLIAGIALVCAAACPAQAATQVIRIQGYVPVVCHADLASLSVPLGDIVQLGTITEFCNDGFGYQLLADYSPLSDPGALIIDGQVVPLGPSGHAVLAQMNGPRAITQSLAYQPGTTPITTLSIQIRASSL